MFIKPFRVKSHSQMKGSDKKKFKAQVKSQFSIPESETAILDTLLAAKEEATSTKIYTHSGESVIVYSIGKDPLFFEVDKQKVLYPTVYTLWKYPHLLGRNYMSTLGAVLPKIANGADLMLPGVVADVQARGMKAYGDGKLKKGDTLYINVVENKAAFAVGTATQSSEDLYMQGMHGKAVIILHFAGDQLWALGSKTKVPDLGSIEELGLVDKWNGSASSNNTLNDHRLEDGANCKDDVTSSIVDETTFGARDTSKDSTSPSIESAVACLLLSPLPHEDNIDLTEERIEEESEGTSKPDIIQDKDNEIEAFRDDDDDGEDDDDENEGDCSEIDPRSPEEIMDDLVERSFFQALKTTAKKIELPILTSTFFRQHMLPACPNEVGGPIDIKKSSYKKLGKFLSKMVDDKIVTVKEQKKGVELIADINYNHEKVIGFRPVKFDVLECDKNKATDEGIYQPPIVTELYLVTAQVANFFSKCGMKKGDGLTSSEIRECIREYVNKEALQHPTDPTIINLDPVIADAVLVKGENLVLTFRWDKLTSRISSKMSKGYSMEFVQGTKSRVIVQKGKLDPIEMTLGTRSGNKKVTLIHNLDIYGIDMNKFAHKCQVGVAASTTVHEASNKKRAGGHPVMEVLVQGNQVAFASKLLLEEYKVSRKYIRGMELAPKGKKSGGSKK